MKKILYILCLIVLGLAANACEKDRLDNSLYDHILPYGTKDDGEDYKDHSKAEGGYRVLSYNVKHCEGTDAKTDYNRIASIINALDADVVCLQELDSMTTRSPVAQVQVLGEKTGMKGYFRATISYQNGKYGIGLLSKTAPVKIHSYSLPGKEIRAVLIAEYANFIVMSTHLALQENNRIESVKILTEKARSFGKKAYLAGDFNESDRSGMVFRELDKDWTVASSTENTFSTTNPNKCIDFIFTLNGEGYNYTVDKTAVVYALPEAKVSVASDHYPVYCDFSN